MNVYCLLHIPYASHLAHSTKGGILNFPEVYWQDFFVVSETTAASFFFFFCPQEVVKLVSGNTMPIWMRRKRCMIGL